jgi:hypothetical protein
MSTQPDFLRTVLVVDAATCLATGACLTLGAALVHALTGIPSTLLFYAGAVLFPVAVLMALTATRRVMPAAMVWLIIAGNALWVAGSVVLMLADWIAPNAWGYAFIAAQALAVAILTALEYSALQRKTLLAA